MSTIREILLDRRREVVASMAPYKAELKEIDTALAAIDDPSRLRNSKRGPTIGEQAMAVIENANEGLPTKQVAKLLADLHGREIGVRNMSWHLSRLKSDGKLVQARGLWKIPPETAEADDASPSPASNESQERPRLLD